MRFGWIGGDMAGLLGQLFLDGLAMGMVYVMLSAGIVFIMSVSRVFYLAYGQFYMVGAYITWAAVSMFGLPFPVGLLLAMMVNAIMGWLSYQFIFEHTINSERMFLATVVAATGLMLVLGQGGLLLFGTTTRSIPVVFRGDISFWGMNITADKAALIVIGIIVTVLLFLLYERTKIGRSMRAVSFAPEAASLQGINTKMICLASVAIGTALAGFAGGIIAPSYGVYPSMGSVIIMPILLIAMLGGIDSLLGSVLAGLVVGLGLSYGQYYLGANAQILVYCIVGIIIFLKPGGILGSGREIGL
jgi:branched-chain amino acid transport system permease protein